jgi:hypothetical protein
MYTCNKLEVKVDRDISKVNFVIAECMPTVYLIDYMKVMYI